MAKWCNYYNCWRSEAEDITEGIGGCGCSCKGCEECEEIKPSEKGC